MPTDTGYRSFVDDLLSHADTSESPERLPEPSKPAEIDDVMRDTTVALTRLTRCIAVTIAPSITVARVKRLDLLSMAPRRALFVLITEAGQVVNRSIELPMKVAPERLAEIERALNASVVGKRACEIRPLKQALDQGAGEPVGDGPLLTRVVEEMIDALEEADRDRLHHAGVPALLAQPEFHDADRARPLIEFLEDGIAVLDSLSEALSSRELTVRIGHENQRVELGNVSIVATAYSAGSAEGLVGVVGPTRMDYQRTIGAVRAAALNLSDAISRQ
jgi:heat-inducible transcriptional repressor